VTTSRPDVMFSVCMCTRFQASPRVIWRQPREYWGTWSLHKMLVCGIPKGLSLSLLDIPIRIMQDAKLREEALRAHVNYWEITYLMVIQEAKQCCTFNRRS
jgi:hypothetical protein